MFRLKSMSFNRFVVNKTQKISQVHATGISTGIYVYCTAQKFEASYNISK